MKYRVYFLIISFLLPMFPFSSHAYNYRPEAGYRSQKHLQYINDADCRDQSVNEHDAFAVVEGAWRMQPFTMPGGIKFVVNEDMWVKWSLDEILWFDLHYNFSTKDGTAGRCRLQKDNKCYNVVG